MTFGLLWVFFRSEETAKEKRMKIKTKNKIASDNFIMQTTRVQILF